jgi:hypothetical protein
MNLDLYLEMRMIAVSLLAIFHAPKGSVLILFF